MSEAQTEQTNTPVEVQISPTVKSGSIFSSRRVRVGLITTAVVSITLSLFLLIFFWHHIIAGRGMKSWSSHAGATPIECMIKDTNNDGYVSCSAMLQGEVVPLECGSSIFNIGCRVNYGAAAAPQVRSFNGRNQNFNNRS
ncbi:MAG: hypothetical protein WBB28_06305 [Crinalium sp.]